MVSVIIPVHNVEQYLCKCIDSVIAQTYRELEIILVDDGSSDRSGIICDEYAETDCRITVIHKSSGGVSDARNAGLDIALGEYIYFLDSDDYIRKDAIERLVSFAGRHGSDIVVFEAVSFVDGTRKAFKDLVYKHDYGCTPKAGAVKQRFDNNEFFPGAPLRFYKFGFLKREGLRFRKGIIYEDLLFSPIAELRAKKVDFLNEVLYFRRIREQSIMTSPVKPYSIRCYRICMKEHIKEKERYPSGSPEAAALECFIKYAAYLCMETYCDLNRHDCAKVQNVFPGIICDLTSLETLNSRKLQLKLRFPKLFRTYRKALSFFRYVH